MSRFASHLAVFTAVLLTSALAQDPLPGPAVELKKFEPLIGNWHGSGDLTDPGGAVTAWQARGTYRWCLNGHFVQEDFTIAFAGMPAPLVFRSYLGWDREHERYVNATVNNGGQAQLHEMQILPDGTILQLMLQHQKQPGDGASAWLPYVERSLFKVDGDTMTHSIDLLLPNGASRTFVEGKFTRGGEAFDGAFDGPTWMGAKPDESIQRLTRAAGEYDVKGRISPEPGKAQVAIDARATFRAVYGGTVLHQRWRGTAEGLPEFAGDEFWAADPRRKQLSGVFVGSLGEVGTLAGHWSEGKLIVTGKSVWRGEPVMKRMLLEFDEAGAATGAVSHALSGTAAPFECLRTTCTKKK